MRLQHIIAVFKAEYFTTTSKFRKYRKWMPLLFISGIFFFSYILRVIYEFFRGNIEVGIPPIYTFFSIITIFSYFTLFAPLLSPLGRVIYDGGARSRREVALSSPVSSKDLLYGNLLSNLAFFLPFFAFIGTLTLSPFIGNGTYNPAVTALLLFIILSALIIIGLVAGTLISPVIYNFIAAQRNTYTRAIVTFSVSGMLILSLPLLRYLLENVNADTQRIGFVTYLPFTIAAILIIFVLYGTKLFISPLVAVIILFGYIILLALVAYFSADTLYGLQNNVIMDDHANPNNKINKFIDLTTAFLPQSIKSPCRAMIKASIRDIEHISRLTIGITITIFMTFALSSRGLFRNTANFNPNVELAVVIFALVLSSASVIFVESSSFTVQHRDMFALIKSAPQGAKKFVISKITQMFYLLTPIFLTLIGGLSIIGLIAQVNVIRIAVLILGIIFTLICFSLTIYLINPADNEEDLTNFINLLFFYLIAFIIAVFPVYFVIADFDLTIFLLGGYLGILVSLAFLSIWLSILTLDQMNLETLDSPLSNSIIHGLKTIAVFVIGWNIIPLTAIIFLLRHQQIYKFILFSTLLTLIVPLVYYLLIDNWRLNVRFNKENLNFSVKYGIIMLLVGGLVGGFASIFNFADASSSFYEVANLLNFSLPQLIFLIIISVIVEEIFFRNLILDFGRIQLTEDYSIILSALLFAFIHLFSIITIIHAFIQGLILGKVKVETNSILYPIFLHLLFNGVIIIGLFGF